MYVTRQPRSKRNISIEYMVAKFNQYEDGRWYVYSGRGKYYCQRFQTEQEAREYMMDRVYGPDWRHPFFGHGAGQ